MRRSLLLALVLAVGCQKSAPKPAAQAQATEPRVAKAEPTRSVTRASRREEPPVKGGNQSMIPQPLPPKPPPKPKVVLAKEDASAAVQAFLTGGGGGSSQERVIEGGGGYTDVHVTAVGDPKEYGQGSKPAWVVPISFTANNPRLKCRVRATNHLFLVERTQENQRPQVIFHGSNEQVARSRLGEDWFILNRPPRPETETNP